MAEETPPAPAPSGDEWPSQAADAIVDLVGKVRDRTTGTAIKASRGVVFGLMAAIVGLCALVLVCILADRVLVLVIAEVLSGIGHDRPGRAAWLADFVMAVLFFFVGLYFWKKANSTPAS